MADGLGDLQLWVRQSGIGGPLWRGRTARFLRSIPRLSKPRRRALTLYRGTKAPGVDESGEREMVPLLRPLSATRSREVAATFANEAGPEGYMHIIRVPAGVPLLDVALHSKNFASVPGSDERSVALREKEVILYRHVLVLKKREGRVSHWEARAR
eukprot:tig00021728_g23297.t1